MTPFDEHFDRPFDALSMALSTALRTPLSPRRRGERSLVPMGSRRFDKLNTALRMTLERGPGAQGGMTG